MPLQVPPKYILDFYSFFFPTKLKYLKITGLHFDSPAFFENKKIDKSFPNFQNKCVQENYLC